MTTLNLRSLIQRLNPVCQRSLEAAVGFCLSRSNYNVEIEHWLLKLIEDVDNDISIILTHDQIDMGRLAQDLQRSLEQLKTGNAQPPVLSQWIVDWLREALLIATIQFDAQSIRSGHLLLALLQDSQLQRIAFGLSSQLKKIKLENIVGLMKTSSEAEQESVSNSDMPKNNINAPALDQFTIDLTEQARQGKIDQVIGRDEEIRQLIDILTRRRQNNPILTGEPGVGKTAVVEGFALRIANDDVPPALQNVSVRTLDMGLLQAGAGVKGEFENRLKSVIQEVKNSSQPVILFIDEAHTLVGSSAGANNDAANLLKPALARGELRTIAATTWAEYKKYFEQDAALARRFQVIKIEEPSEQQAIPMLRGLVGHLETHHNIRILDEAVIAAVQLSHRYIASRQLPDKAISVLDTACSRLAIRETTLPAIIDDGERRLSQLKTEIALLNREVITGVSHKKRLKKLSLQKETIESELLELRVRWEQEQTLIKNIRVFHHQLEKGEGIEMTQLKKLKKQLSKLQEERPLLQVNVDAQAIAEVIAAWTGIPIGRMLGNEIRNVLSLEDRLQERIVGQSHALKTISHHIYTSKAQLTDPRKPIGVFLFVGPSGVGKTETAITLAEQLYGGEQNMTVINLSEFKEEHKVSLLLGSPPGYVGYGEGGILTEAVRRRPYSLVLLDEVEKAHNGVQDIFYQVFDKGSLRDGQGRDIDFKNTVIILTSNVGSDILTKLCADPETLPTSPEEIVALLRPELLKVFKPAFLGRLVVIPYLSLSDEIIKKIVTMQLQRIQKRIHENYQAEFYYTDAVVEHIRKRCQEVESGARNIEHLLNKTLLPELSIQFLSAMAEGKAIRRVQVDLDASERFSYELNYNSALHW
jgi:type VI secretion system protein VasG